MGISFDSIYIIFFECGLTLTGEWKLFLLHKRQIQLNLLKKIKQSGLRKTHAFSPVYSSFGKGISINVQFYRLLSFNDITNEIFSLTIFAMGLGLCIVFYLAAKQIIIVISILNKSFDAFYIPYTKKMNNKINMMDNIHLPNIYTAIY